MTTPYRQAYADFDADRAARDILGDDHAALNAAVLCCDRHCGIGRGALNAVARDGSSRRFGFDDLKDRSERFARVLRDEGVTAGAVVAGLLPRIPELLGALRHDDLFALTADHGCDPADSSTDHTRENVPLLVAGPRVPAGLELGVRESFADLGATLAENFGLGPLGAGRSFLTALQAASP